MTKIVTENISRTNIDNFRRVLSSPEKDILYLFIGKPNPWEDDQSVPAPKDTQQSVAEIWDEMIGMKLVSPGSIRNVVKRINWEKFKVYAQYDNLDTELKNKEFYVLNSKNEVFKCISNNNGSESLQEPIGKNLNIITLSDGYRWKYLYTISTLEQLRFLTSKWMPVSSDEDVLSSAKDGAIEHILINSGGIDHSFFAKLNVKGDGAGADIIPRSSVGVIQTFNYANVGIGYRYADLEIEDTSGRFSNLRAIISPVGGHGYSPEKELFSEHIMINSKIEYFEGVGDFPSDVKYRRLGLIKNPLQTNGNIANASSMSALYKVELNQAFGDFENNEYIEGEISKANAYVITNTFTEGNGIISYIQTKDLTDNFLKFQVGENIIGKKSGATGKVKQLKFPEVRHDTGDIIYVENISPITRLSDQSENLHIVLKF